MAANHPNTLKEAKATGSKFYFTGMPCKHGNVALRLTSAGACWCDDCKKLHSGKVNSWQKRNHEKSRANVAGWRADNGDNIRVYRRDYKDKNRQRERERHLLSTYGITLAEYEAMYLAQGGCCALCNVSAEQAARRRLFVDHCHTTKRVRGLLCDNCNKALGYVEKNAHRLDALLEYAGKK